MNESKLDAALGALERAALEPMTLSIPFLEMFPVTGASVSTLGSLLGSETVSASDGLAARVDELQFDLAEGPCWDAMNHAKPVLEPDVQSPHIVWPAFSRALMDHPIASLFAFPLRVGPLRVGAVDLYSSHPIEFDSTQSRQATIMSRAAGRHVFRRALEAVGQDYDDTGNAYSRRLVHQATGMVLAQLKIPVDDARLIIQGQAFALGRSMMDVAHDITESKLAFTHGDSGIEVSNV